MSHYKKRFCFFCNITAFHHSTERGGEKHMLKSMWVDTHPIKPSTRSCINKNNSYDKKSNTEKPPKVNHATLSSCKNQHSEPGQTNLSDKHSGDIKALQIIDYHQIRPCTAAMGTCYCTVMSLIHGQEMCVGECVYGADLDLYTQ